MVARVWLCVIGTCAFALTLTVGNYQAEPGLIGSSFPISFGSTAVGSAAVPFSGSTASVAYSSAARQFLVVWADNRNAASPDSYFDAGVDIYGRLVNTDGTVPGADFAISRASSSQLFPTVTYNPQDDEFLVAWTDNRSGGGDLYGQRVKIVNGQAELISGEFRVSPGAQGMSGGDLTVTWEQLVPIEQCYVDVTDGVNWFSPGNDPVPCTTPGTYSQTKDIGFILAQTPKALWTAIVDNVTGDVVSDPYLLLGAPERTTIPKANILSAAVSGADLTVTWEDRSQH